jgi:hypothetical protein
MDNSLRIPDIYPVNFAKTLTLKVNNIVKHNDTPVGYSFTVEDDYGFIANFDQHISIHPLHSQKIVVTASVGMLRYRRMIDQDPLINGCVGLLPPGNKMLEYCIIYAYDELRARMGKPLKRVNVKVKWPEKEDGNNV